MDANVVHPEGRAEHIQVFTTKTGFWYIYEDSARERFRFNNNFVLCSGRQRREPPAGSALGALPPSLSSSERRLHVHLFYHVRKQTTDLVLARKICLIRRTLRRVCQCGFSRLSRRFQRVLTCHVLSVIGFRRVQKVHRHLFFATRTAFENKGFRAIELAAKARKCSGQLYFTHS